jgi:hypothetical protein
MIVPFLDTEIEELNNLIHQASGCFCAILIVDQMSKLYRLEVHHCRAFTRPVFPIAKYDLEVPWESTGDKCN